MSVASVVVAAHVLVVVVVVVVVVARGTPSQELELPEIQGHRRRVPAERGQGGSIVTEDG